MTDTRGTIERIHSANPVPSPISFPTGALSSADLLTRIDERSKVMTDTLTPIRGTDPGKPPSRSRGPLIVVAVAAVVILIIGLATFSALTGDESPVVTDPPAPLLQSPLPADTPPLEVVAAIQAEWDAGDLEGAEELIRPDSAYFTGGLGAEIAEEVWYRAATGISVDRRCAEETPPELAELQFEGTVVTCTETLQSGLAPGIVAGGGTTVHDVRDGWIVGLYIAPGYRGALSELDPQNLNQAYFEYRTWMETTFPDRFAELFDAASLRIILDSLDARAAHQGFVPFFLADTGTREAPSLPADTPLLDVVATFIERYEAGDVPGWEAIFHPLSGYDSGQDAEASWFSAVTGMTGDRDCTLVAPTQVSCDEIVYSGLVPGTVVGDFTSVWNGSAGWIWSIEFVDGPPQYATNPTLAPGVKEYRDWVKANEPDAFDTLFVGGLGMRLGTEEMRDAHREMVAAYLASLGEA